MPSWSDTDRWEWYAVGDKSLARPVSRAPLHKNAAEQVSWEIGLVFAVPLALAAVAALCFGN